MAILTIRLNGKPKVLEHLLVNELEALLNPLSADAAVLISVKNGAANITFENVSKDERAAILEKAKMVMDSFALNQ